MILVTLGTQDKKFYRILEEIDKLISKKIIKEEVIVQAGYSSDYKSKNMKILDLIPVNEFDSFIKKCDLLITHGGVGSILTGLINDKKVIAIPRLEKYDEHENDHQLQIINNFDSMNYIISIIEVSELENALKKIKKFIPQKYKSNNKEFVKLIEDFIEEK